MCLPPSKSVVIHVRTMPIASSWVTVRWPIERTFASLWARFQMANCSDQHTPQRTPRTRLATIASPLPDPPSTIPRSNSPRATDSATGRMKSGKSQGSSESVPMSRTLWPSARRTALITSLYLNPAWSEPMAIE